MMARLVKAAPAALATAFAVWGAGASAWAQAPERASRCPEWAKTDAPPLERVSEDWSEEDRRFLKQGRRFDATGLHWVRGVWFQMPYGYLIGRRLKSFPDFQSDHEYLDWTIKNLSENSFKGYDAATGLFNPELKKYNTNAADFAFWAPSKRYLERSLQAWLGVKHAAFGFRPCERGRSEPKDDDYVVKFKIIWPFLSGIENSQIGKEFRNSIRRHERLERDIESEEKDKLKIDGRRRYIIYHNDEKLYVNFGCSPYKKLPPHINPSCYGRVWRKDLDLVLHLSFPADRGRRGSVDLWREPVELAVELAQEWRDNALRSDLLKGEN